MLPIQEAARILVINLAPARDSTAVIMMPPLTAAVLAKQRGPIDSACGTPASLQLELPDPWARRFQFRSAE
jgi:hypothetical protein